MTEKTYSKKFNAQRAAKARGLTENDIERVGPGSVWIVKTQALPVELPQQVDIAPEVVAAATAIISDASLPLPPNFEANTHKPYRGRLAKLVAMAEARDAEGLKAVQINPTSTSPKALLRYRNAVLAALGAA